MTEEGLGPQLDHFVSDLVRAGRYESEISVLRAGVRLLQARESRLVDLDRSIENGIADADGGRVSSVDDVRKRLHARITIVSVNRER